MTSQNTSKKAPETSHTGLVLLGGLVAAAAGAYYIYGNKNAQKQIKKVKGWALKAKGEVIERLERIKAVDEELYHKVVDAVMNKYQKVKGIDIAEVASVAKELKSHWNNIKKELSGTAKSVSKGAKKVTKVAKKAKDAVTK